VTSVHGTYVSFEMNTLLGDLTRVALSDKMCDTDSMDLLMIVECTIRDLYLIFQKQKTFHVCEAVPKETSLRPTCTKPPVKANIENVDI
jgi:hypothetical protein